MKYIKKIKNGIKFFIRPGKSDESIIEEVWSKRHYQRLGLEIKDHFNVIDIGAHIGIFTVYAAIQAKKVFSYEPAPENFELLKKNIMENNLRNVEIFNYVVSDKKGTARLFLDENDPAAHSFFKNCSKSIIVNALTLKDIFEKNNIDFCHFLKIDAEGAEYKILYNTPDEYFKKIGSIMLEYHDSTCRGSLRRLVNILNKSRFKIKIQTNSYNKGILLARSSKKPKVILKFQNYSEYFSAKSIKPVFAEIDRLIGQIGLFLKKHFPETYYLLKGKYIKK